MRRLCDVPWEELMIGDFIISNTGLIGRIDELIQIDYATQNEDNEIIIKWSNGKFSALWHHEGVYVHYDELSNLILRNSNAIV